MYDSTLCIVYRYSVSSTVYRARKYVVDSFGNRTRAQMFFATLSEAREWQSAVQVAEPNNAHVEDQKRGMLFGNLIAEWRKRTYPGLALTTQVHYDKLVKLYMGDLCNFGVRELTPQVVDQWLDKLKDEKGPAMRSTKRRSFKHELKLLSTILHYYDEYHDDPEFDYPIKRRHRKAIKVRVSGPVMTKDLSEFEFHKFRNELLKQAKGEILAVMATVQYFQALRVSEVAGIHHEDVKIDPADPSKSRLVISHMVVWPRVKAHPSHVREGFKNSEANDGFKEQPIFPQAFKALMQVWKPDQRGLLFKLDGKHFEYRPIQHAYDKAFKAAGLHYRGTHIMRHGGCRNVYNRVPDPAIAQQLLGNTSLKATLVYAKRYAAALTEVAQEEWSKVNETGSFWVAEGDSEHARPEDFEEPHGIKPLPEA